MGFFKKLFRGKPKYHMQLHMNAKFNPIDRGIIFEDNFHKLFQTTDLGEVDGGGTLISAIGEPLESDVEFYFWKDPAVASANAKDELIQCFNRFGLPKGSSLRFDNDDEWSVGTLEGLAIYFNGTELPLEVYKTCDINYAVSEIERLLQDELQMRSSWEGGRETALYLYGASFESMRGKIADFLATYPLCQKCRVV